MNFQLKYKAFKTLAEAAEFFQEFVLRSEVASLSSNKTVSWYESTSKDLCGDRVLREKLPKEF